MVALLEEAGLAFHLAGPITAVVEAAVRGPALVIGLGGAPFQAVVAIEGQDGPSSAGAPDLDAEPSLDRLGPSSQAA